MKCKTCGEALRDNAVACEMCGTSTSGISREARPSLNSAMQNDRPITDFTKFSGPSLTQQQFQQRDFTPKTEPSFTKQTEMNLNHKGVAFLIGLVVGFFSITIIVPIIAFLFLFSIYNREKNEEKRKQIRDWGFVFTGGFIVAVWILFSVFR